MSLTRVAACLTLIAAVTGLSPAGAQEAAPSLHRGLNLSSWLANAPRQPLFARDFTQIKHAGFDHVRLPFNPEYHHFSLSEDGGDPSRLDFADLDRAIAMADEAGLPLILDIHPSGEFVETLEKHHWAEKEFISLWQAVATHYKDHPSSRLIFELLNEPQYYKDETLWNDLSAQTVAAIRAISPDRLIVIGAPHGSDIEGLSSLKPSDDPHLIYSFHFYEPYLVTHQGIHMGFEKKMIRYFREMPYPSDLATQSAATYAPEAPSLSQADRELREYLHAPWNANHIKARIDLARDWATAHHVRLLCGEFGVLRNHIDTDSRYRWIGDARQAMDADNIGWELWDYDDIFGIAPPLGATSTDPVDGSVTLNDPQKGSRHFEPQALKALGLKAPNN